MTRNSQGADSDHKRFLFNIYKPFFPWACSNKAVFRMAFTNTINTTYCSLFFLKLPANSTSSMSETLL